VVPGGTIDVNTAVLFPGQGSQFVGMGRDVYEASPAARRTFEQAQSVLDFDLARLCFDGPEERLNDTHYTQPALVAVSIALLEALRELGTARGLSVTPRYTAGHSLGQYSALVAAGSLDIAEAVRLVRERGRLMKESGEANPGGMAAIIGLDDSALESVCGQAREKGIVYPANFNSPGQIVISGDLTALATAMQLALAAGARRAVQLAVSIAAHSPLMQGAAEQFSDVLGRINLGDARVPVISNVTAQALTFADDLRIDLARQITRSVRWAQSVQEMLAGGATTFVEVGPGQVLSGLIKRTSKEAQVLNVADLKSLERCVGTLRPGGA
jgi:[acyl-carrier-protein] S-malonyltransferase